MLSRVNNVNRKKDKAIENLKKAVRVTEDGLKFKDIAIEELRFESN